MQPVFTSVFSAPDMLLVAAVALLLFGGKKIGDLGKGLGEGIRNFKAAMKDDEPKREEPKRVEDNVESKT